MAVGQRTLDLLRPWLEDQGPNSQSEWGMYCPFHDDSKRSASFNTERGVFYCQTCDLGISAKELTTLIKDGKYRNDRSQVPQSPSENRAERLSEARVPGWASALLGNRAALRRFQERRGLDRETIEAYGIGWDKSAGAYTIPIHDEEGGLLNIRRYSLDPGERRKMWSVAGHGTPVLYPIEGHHHWGKQVIICEGELDALLTIQHGFDAVTRTGAAKVWRPEWNQYFIGKDVYLCHDMDTPGQDANAMHAASLATVAHAVFIVMLPYPVTPKDGKDLTDFWMDGHDASDFKRLMAEATPYERTEELVGEVEPEDIEDVTVLDSFDPANMGKYLRMKVTIVGKASNNYLVPHEVLMHCTQDAGAKCKTCVMGKPEDMGKYNGEQKLIVHPSDPILLEFQNSSNHQVADLLRQRLGAEKCHKLSADGLAFHSIDEVFVRPSVDLSSVGRVDHIKRRFTLVDQHATLPNNTVQVVGAMYPNPRSQANEFQAWELESTLTNVDHFEVTEEAKRQLRKFQIRENQSPLTKAMDIAHDLSMNVTHIYDRDEMHVFFDLIYHSVLQFEFLGRLEPKGWLEGLIVGDTRTGKSKIGQDLTRYYGAGEFINSESASVAGILGGVQQIGREWIITWGAVPLNDRRAVILDEISGLKLEQLSQLSGMRSSGEAQITKIVAESTPARTRAVWLGNPRDGRRMDDFTYGVQAIRPLIGNNEDVARFDIAMTVSSKEVASAVINERKNENTSSRRYPSSSCRTLINWCWTRRAEHVKWRTGAESAVLDAAVVLGNAYREDPPLIQAANVRLKIARIAVALAARTVSTDKNFEHVIVTKQHVADAVKFLDIIYGNPHFGYRELSEEAVRDRHKAKKHTIQVETYLKSKPGLSKFLRESEGHFRRQDMEDMLNWSREAANATINALYEARMIRRNQANIHINPELHQLVREIEE